MVFLKNMLENESLEEIRNRFGERTQILNEFIHFHSPRNVHYLLDIAFEEKRKLFWVNLIFYRLPLVRFQ